MPSYNSDKERKREKIKSFHCLTILVSIIIFFNFKRKNHPSTVSFQMKAEMPEAQYV